MYVVRADETFVSLIPGEEPLYQTQELTQFTIINISHPKIVSLHRLTENIMPEFIRVATIFQALHKVR